MGFDELTPNQLIEILEEWEAQLKDFECADEMIAQADLERLEP